MSSVNQAFQLHLSIVFQFHAGVGASNKSNTLDTMTIYMILGEQENMATVIVLPWVEVETASQQCCGRGAGDSAWSRWLGKVRLGSDPRPAETMGTRQDVGSAEHGPCHPDPWSPESPDIDSLYLHSEAATTAFFRQSHFMLADACTQVVSYDYKHSFVGYKPPSLWSNLL